MLGAVKSPSWCSATTSATAPSTKWTMPCAKATRRPGGSPHVASLATPASSAPCVIPPHSAAEADSTRARVQIRSFRTRPVFNNVASNHPLPGNSQAGSNPASPVVRTSRWANSLFPKPADQDYADIVFDSTTNLWSCCGVDQNGDLDCGNPTNETFYAPPPDILLQNVLPSVSVLPSGSATATAGLAVSPSTSPSASYTATSSSVSHPTTPTPASPSQSTVNAPLPLSVGAAAGITVGALAVLLAVLVALELYIRRIRRRRVYDPTPSKSSVSPTLGTCREDMSPIGSYLTSGSGTMESRPEFKSELSAEPHIRYELDSTPARFPAEQSRIICHICKI